METIGDAYMVICGAPELTPNHAEYVTDFAFSIIEATSKINDPSTNKSLLIRVGRLQKQPQYARSVKSDNLMLRRQYPPMSSISSAWNYFWSVHRKINDTEYLDMYDFPSWRTSRW